MHEQVADIVEFETQSEIEKKTEKKTSSRLIEKIKQKSDEIYGKKD
ncbi:hypothetical protein BpJC7_27440 [Weizmannia acidilactici]|uniref:Uncharacterized protein n=1 Tax=Weizmannia acidilactici TaxID=2607726 RepID=A0A5J4JI90_9BACI|nr:hypothetical protein BpJC7_27440 [Weizmannia acidilactici]